MRQLDNILTEMHGRNMEMCSTAFVKIRISIPFIYIPTCWFLWLWCNWLSLKMVLPEVWGLCLSLMNEQSCQLLPDLRQIKVRIFCFVWCFFSPVTVSSILFSKRYSAALFLSAPHSQPSFLRMGGSACGLFLFSLQWLWHFQTCLQSRATSQSHYVLWVA